ncbi:TPA: helix-turn-helix domain-containing protein [Morganella morganii]|uniref:helix-turn-helix domain-containing protein n=1 Tax=Morganella morganii TaxID=582 RepID=UPI000BBD02A4|nr:S24 family peptidase [Morganella morganii]ATF54451.1 LexA family transcriptional repressor [Morganella morganii]EKU4002974.1 helix-turn-helix domain-containing protein [Morganella morganii]MBT0407764.1 helix-turn-helix domain-containing protein [Morganella morganii subsp. morganii]HDU8602608.1 helix-turn-helix domain-containing protein [Morganella morganii]
MKTLSERLSKVRQELGLTQQELADRAGVTRVAISKAEQGLTKSFNSDTLFDIAKALNVDPYWLQLGSDKADRRSYTDAIFKKKLKLKLADDILSKQLQQPLPISGQNDPSIIDCNIKPHDKQPDSKYSYPKINWVQAGAFARNGDDYSQFEIENWYDSIKYAGERGYWLEVKGDSMSSPVGITFPEGMIILVDPEKDPYPNCYVVAEIKDTNEATFKKFICDSGRDYLKPLNPNYPLIPMDEKIKIIGVVVDAKWDIF